MAARQRSRARNLLEFWLFRAARGIATSLAPASLAALGSGLGAVYGVVGQSRRRILHFNLAHALPELEPAARRRLGWAIARHFGRVSLDALRVQRLTPEALLAEVRVEGEEHLWAARAEGRGVLLLSAHIGGWEVAALAGGLLVPGGLAVVHRPLDNPLLEAELLRFRARFGNRSLGKRGIVREILRELRSEGVVGILIDQRARPGEAITVPFFGRPVAAHPILARLALRTAAPVVPLWGLWEGPGRYTVRFDPPLRAVAGDDDLSLTARYMATIEGVIRERPEQWLWFHDRWRDERLAEAGGE